MENNGSKLLFVAGGIIVAFICFLLFFPVFTVGAGQVGVTFNRFSGVTKSYSQGANFYIPLVQSVYKFDVKTQRDDVIAEGASKDLQVVKVDVALNYHLEYDKVNELFVKVGRDYKVKILEPSINEVVKSAIAMFPVEQIIVEREKVKNVIEERLKEKLSVYHIALENINLVDIDFSDEFNKVVEQKQIEEQKIKTAEYQKKQAIEYKQKTILEAEAEAKKQELMRTSLTSNIVALEWIKKWNGSLPVTMLGDKSVPMIDISK